MIRKLFLLKKLLTWIPNLIRRRKKPSRYKGLDQKDLKILGLGSMILEEYIRSRKFRRLFKDSDVSKYIEGMLIEWGENTQDK